ncbi:MAG: LysE/ArgO family amino acid transporter [Pseudomonadota bacterium]
MDETHNLFLAALNGFLLGASLIIAIGPQNAFVLRQGLKRSYVFSVSLICALSDALLITIGVAGLGTLVQQSPQALDIVAIGGAIFLVVYGLIAFKRALHPSAIRMQGESTDKFSVVIATCLAFTFLNPHVYLDTVVLLGSLSAHYSGTARIVYGASAALASFVWFFSLGYGARLLTPVFEKPQAWRILDISIGLVMWLIAARLVFGVFT